MEKDKTHLTMDDRATIAAGLEQKKTATEIAGEVGCAKTTISREVKGHFIVEKKGAYGRSFNDCSHRTDCKVAHECMDCKNQRRNSCAYCQEICCTEKCKDYSPYRCKTLERFPFVCNGCEKKHGCTLEKHIYSPNMAQKEYKETLSSSREVLHVTESQLAEIEITLKNGLAKGQSINHIYSYAGGSLPVCERTAYQYINSGFFRTVIRLDQPKAVRFTKRPKKAGDEKRKKDSSYLKGRTYADFLVVIQEDGHPPVVEMDCVEGARDGNGKVLLTLLFRCCSLQISFVMDKQDTEHVTATMNALRDKIGADMFETLFPIILTDRGSEFSSPEAIEVCADGRMTTSVYYCNPGTPEEKPFCERNHSEIRKILKKGKDIDFDQTACDGMMDNINSYSRPQYNNKSAYDMFVFFYGEKAAKALGINKIPPKDINLTPSCLTPTAN